MIKRTASARQVWPGDDVDVYLAEALILSIIR